MHRSGVDPWRYPDVDYFKEVLKPVSLLSSADISLSGGSEAIRYFLSFNALYEDGYYRNSQNSYNQYSFRSNIDGQVTDNIRSEEHTSELQSRGHLVCRLLLEKKKQTPTRKSNQ